MNLTATAQVEQKKRFDPTELMRWIPVVSMMLVSTISYIDRNTIGPHARIRA